MSTRRRCITAAATGRPPPCSPSFCSSSRSFSRSWLPRDAIKYRARPAEVTRTRQKNLRTLILRGPRNLPAGTSGKCTAPRDVSFVFFGVFRCSSPRANDGTAAESRNERPVCKESAGPSGQRFC